MRIIRFLDWDLETILFEGKIMLQVVFYYFQTNTNILLISIR